MYVYRKGCNRSYLHEGPGYNTGPRSHSYQTKSPSPSAGYFPLSCCWGRGVPEPPKQSLSPGYPEKLEDKSLLMRTPLALVSAHGKIRQQCGLPDTLAAVLGCPCQINLQSSETKFCGFWATECLIICYSHSRKLIPPPDWAPITDKETGEWKCCSHSGIKLIYSLHFLGTIFKNYKGKTSPATPAWETSVSVLTTDIDECVLFNGVWVLTVFDYEL